MALKKPYNSSTQKKVQQFAGKTNTARPNTVKNYQPAKNFRQLIDEAEAWLKKHLGF